MAERAIVSGRPRAGARTWWLKRIAAGGITSLTSIACPTASVCVASDDAGNVLTSTNPVAGTWSSSDIDGRTAIAAVSCPSASSCVAVGGEGDVLTSSRPTGGASAWTVTKGPVLNIYGTDYSFSDVSCPSTSLCVGAIGNDIVTSSDPAGGSSAWTVQYADYGAFCEHELCVGITHVTCPTTTLCVAVDNVGNVLTSTDPTGGTSAWKSTTVGCTGEAPACGAGVSCPSASFCIASTTGHLLTSEDPADGEWNATPFPNGTPVVFPGSCPTAGICVGAQPAPPGTPLSEYSALNSDLDVSTDPAGGPGEWTVSTEGRYDITGVSCPSTTLCVAIDTAGDVVVGHEDLPATR